MVRRLRRAAALRALAALGEHVALAAALALVGLGLILCLHAACRRR